MTSQQPSGFPEHPTVSSLFLSGIQEMKPEAWSRFVNTFGPVVYRWCQTSGVADADRPDLVQEVFAAVTRGVGQFERQKEQGSFRSWLATITRNKVRDYFRKAAGQQQAAGGTAALESIQQIEDQLETTINPATVQDLVMNQALKEVEAEFEPATWNAFWQTAVDNRRASDVAQANGMSVASVYQAKSRVLRRLRAYLAEIPS